jgi:hypothetical protein
MSHPHSDTDSARDDGASLEDRLITFYTAVSRATAFGHFKGHHGPLEETAWVHVAIHQLDEVDRLAVGVLDQDVRHLARLRTILDQASDAVVVPAAADTTPGKQVLRGREPAVVATAALLLDRLTTPQRPYTGKALNYYSARATSVQLVLDRAVAVVSGNARIDRFRDYVAQLNPLGGPGHAGHHAETATPGGASHSHAVGHSHDHPSSEVDAAFSAVIEAAANSHHSAVESVAAACHCGALSAASMARIEQLSVFLRDNAPHWQQFLTRDGVVIEGQLIVLPPTARRPRCVPGKPQHGGQWEIASLRATETDELCPPGEALHDAGSRTYGQAGADLIKAQNEWIEAQQCFDDAYRKTGSCRETYNRAADRCKRIQCTAFTDCDSIECTLFTNCDGIQCTSYTDCAWWNLPCKALRAGCVAAAEIARGACWVARGACVAAAAVAAAACWVARGACEAAAAAARAACIAVAAVALAACSAVAYVVAAGCATLHIAKGAGHAAAGAGGIALGVVLKTAGNVVGGICKWFGVKPSSREVSRLKVVGVHLAVLHTNKVLLFSYDEGVYPVNANNPADFTAIGDSDRGLCALWDFRNGTAKYIKLKRNLFCAHQSFTGDGRLFVAGGQFPLPGLLKDLFPPTLLAPGADKDVHLFDPASETWTRLPDMAKGRWYPTCVTLPDGKVFISSGTNGWATEAGLGRGIQDTWQIADPVTGSVGPPNPFKFHLYHLYPFQHVLPSGQVFIHFKRKTILFDPATNQMMRVAASGATPQQTGRTRHWYSRTGPGPGTCVLLPLLPQLDEPSGEVRYPAGRIMILGGGGAEKEPEPPDKIDEEPPPVGTGGYDLHSDTKATNTAEILDFSDQHPEWRYTNESMHHPRVMPDSVLLPNGKVLVVGGGRFGQSGGLLAHFTSTDTQGNPDKGATDPVLAPEMFDPVTETWEELCPKSLERLYHTTAVLLPDARVLVAGHDGALNMAPYDASQYELELFSPPYLFAPDGTPAVRPAIIEAPASANLGHRFGIRTREAAQIASVVLIRQSSTTHQINTDQRLVGLAIVGAGGDQLQVQMPWRAGVAPPGFYMLFIVNRSGVPSVAHWMRVNTS